MPPNKRRGPANAEHRGRVTVPHKPGVPDHRRDPALGERAAVHRDAKPPPTPSSRYTAPKPSIRLRPEWHRMVGIAIAILGVAVIALNDVVLLGHNLSLLPGGHNELYLVLGVAVLGYSTKWFGWFDRAQ